MKTTSLCSVWKKLSFLQYYINSELCMSHSQSDWKTINIRNN